MSGHHFTKKSSSSKKPFPQSDDREATAWVMIARKVTLSELPNLLQANAAPNSESSSLSSKKASGSGRALVHSKHVSRPTKLSGSVKPLVSTNTSTKGSYGKVPVSTKPFISAKVASASRSTVKSATAFGSKRVDNARKTRSVAKTEETLKSGSGSMSKSAFRSKSGSPGRKSSITKQQSLEIEEMVSSSKRGLGSRGCVGTTRRLPTVKDKIANAKKPGTPPKQSLNVEEVLSTAKCGLDLKSQGGITHKASSVARKTRSPVLVKTDTSCKYCSCMIRKVCIVEIRQRCCFDCGTRRCC